MEKKKKTAQPGGLSYMEQIREDALRILDYGDNTASELVRKLVKKGHDEGKAEQVTAVLVSQDLVNDRRYAENYARVKAGSGKGPIWIRQKLTEKGVSSADISAALAEHADRDAERVLCAKKALKICGLESDFELDEYGSLVPAEDSAYIYERASIFELDEEEAAADRQAAYKYREKQKAKLVRRLASAGFSPSAVYYTVSKIADL